MSLGLRSALRTALAITAWAALHSLLASRTVKHLPTKLLGRNLRNATYRLAYNGIAVGTMAALLLYLRRLPDREVYTVEGSGRLPFHVARLLLLVAAFAAALQIGVGPFSGLSEASDYLRGRAVDEEPEAQGPSLQPAGHAISWPYRLTRHPLNFSFSAVLFLTPEMTVVRLTIALTTLLYSLVGSKLEERRLTIRYGERYDQYRNSGVPFFFPTSRLISGPAASLPALVQR